MTGHDAYHFAMIDKRITIIGAGSMGTAMAKLLGDKGLDIRLWAYEPEVAHDINKNRVNTAFLKNAKLPETVRATNSLEEAMGFASMVLSVTPSQVLRSVWNQALPALRDDAVVVCMSKGVETGSLATMSEVFAEIIPNGTPEKFAFLSGPSFAKEIAADHPTAVVVASESEALAERAQDLLSSPYFRVYTSDDVAGVELGGALKNVIAIGVGVAEGMGLGLNSRAALITRGLAEISRLAVTCGANPLTLAGLAGMGDLVLTCTGHLSRNLQVGIRLGKGEALDDILGSMTMVAEGVKTTSSALELAKKYDVEMPITVAVAALLAGETTAKEAVQSLMARKLRSERES